VDNRPFRSEDPAILKTLNGISQFFSVSREFRQVSVYAEVEIREASHSEAHEILSNETERNREIGLYGCLFFALLLPYIQKSLQERCVVAELKVTFSGPKACKALLHQKRWRMSLLSGERCRTSRPTTNEVPKQSRSVCFLENLLDPQPSACPLLTAIQADPSTPELKSKPCMMPGDLSPLRRPFNKSPWY